MLKLLFDVDIFDVTFFDVEDIFVDVILRFFDVEIRVALFAGLVRDV